MPEVLAHASPRSNADLMVACHTLGYLRDDDTVLDATYGKGTFWRKYRPALLVTNDLKQSTDAAHHYDFRSLPNEWASFDVVVLDPPYKLNGTPDKREAGMDSRYGVDVPATWQGRMALCEQGIIAVAPLASRVLMVKCMDQVSSGKVRWQTRIFADVAEAQGFRLEDSLLMRSGRPQPDGRSQQHARRNFSTLLVLERVR